MELLVDQPVRIDNINILPDVSNRGPRTERGLLVVRVNVSGDANRNVACTSVVAARTGLSSQHFSLQVRSVGCMNCTSELSAAALLEFELQRCEILSRLLPRSIQANAGLPAK